MQINSAPNGIAIGGGTVTNPTVNNFGPPEPKIWWQQEPKSGDPKAVSVTVFVDRSMELPAFGVQCDRPCETTFAGPDGIVQRDILHSATDPRFAGVVFMSPRPLGAGICVHWTITSEDDVRVKILSLGKLSAEQLPERDR